jgi:hypothetical protein
VTAELQVNLRKLAAPAPAPTRSKPLPEVAPTRPKPFPEVAPALPTASIKAAQTGPTRSSLLESRDLVQEEESFLADFLIKEEEEEDGGDPRAEDEEVSEAFRGWRQVDIAPAHRDGTLLLFSNSKGWIRSETRFNWHNWDYFLKGPFGMNDLLKVTLAIFFLNFS